MKFYTLSSYYSLLPVTVPEMLAEYIADQGLEEDYLEGVTVKELSFTYNPRQIKDSTLWRTADRATIIMRPTTAAVKQATITLSVHVKNREQAWTVADAFTKRMTGELLYIQSDYTEHYFRGVLTDLKNAESVNGRKYKLTLTMTGQEIGGPRYNQRVGDGTTTIYNSGTAYSPAVLTVGNFAGSAKISGVLRDPATYAERTLERTFTTEHPSTVNPHLSSIKIDGITGGVYPNTGASYTSLVVYNSEAEFNEWVAEETASMINHMLFSTSGLPLIPPGSSTMEISDSPEGVNVIAGLLFFPVYL